MSQRTLLIGSETGLASTTTLDNATVVRVYNGVAGTATVSVAKSTATGYANTSTVTLPQDHVEFFEKSGADQIWASDNAVVGAKVGFTG